MFNIGFCGAYIEVMSDRQPLPCRVASHFFKGLVSFRQVKIMENNNKRKYLSGKFRSYIWKKYDKICQKCGVETVLFGNTVSPLSPSPCAIDHIVPFSKGGSCDESNFQLLCISCNASKGSKNDQN